MSSIVIKNPDIGKIYFKKPQRITDKIYTFDVKYNKNANFIIQTPKMLIPNAPYIYQHQNIKFYKIPLIGDNYKFDENTKNFIKIIKEIDNLVKLKMNYFWKKCGFSEKRKSFVDSYNFNSKKTKVFMYPGIQVYNNKPEISIFDWEKNKKDYNFIVPQSKAYSLIWLKNIWLKTRKIGLNWVVLQMKIYLPIYKIDECLIEDEEQIHKKMTIQESQPTENTNDNEDVGIKYIDHPIYSKFFKMKKFGIPIPSIKHKLQMENLNTEIIDNDPDDVFKSPNENKISTNTNSMMNVLSGLSSVKLKKAKKIKVKRQQPKTVNTNRPPTLEEILNRRSSLKKVNRDLI